MGNGVVLKANCFGMAAQNSISVTVKGFGFGFVVVAKVVEVGRVT